MRAWEISAALDRPEASFVFRFENAVVEKPRQPKGYVESSGGGIVCGGRGVVSIGLPSYPEPPEGFCVSEEVQMMWQRYRNYRQGTEPLTSMAYFCLTVLERNAGGRKLASEKFGVDRKELDKLGELTSACGDAFQARKAYDRVLRTRLTPQERRWIEATVRHLIRRVAKTTA